MNKKVEQRFAETKNCSSAQLALAWVLAQGDDIIPIPGTKRRKYLNENVGAINVELSNEDINAIENLLKKFPNIGPRYSEREEKFVEKK